MNIKPLADRVLIEPKEAETKTAGGLFIPDTAKEKPQQGLFSWVDRVIYQRNQNHLLHAPWYPGNLFAPE